MAEKGVSGKMVVAGFFGSMLFVIALVYVYVRSVGWHFRGEGATTSPSASQPVATMPATSRPN